MRAAPLEPEPQTRRAIAPRWLRALVRFMDDAIAIPGTRLRFGWDAVFGLIVPGAGDALSAVSHVTLIWAAFRARVPRVVFARMLLNAAVDAAVGTVPLLGDAFDATYKANRKNLELIERYERGTGKATLADYAVVALTIIAALGVLLLPILIAGWVIAQFVRA